MKNLYLLLTFFLFTQVSQLSALNPNPNGPYSVSGVVVDKQSQETIIAATVQLIDVGGKMIYGVATDANGAFTLKGIEKGKYTLKITYVGYETKQQTMEFSLSKTKKHTDLGFITLSENTVMLNETVVSANAAKVKVSGDSIIFNASAFRTPEGSTLEALVKKLPGAQVDADGKVTINGKEVKKIMVDGKEFFLNDTEVAMKNIPVNIVENIKTYDKKSDLSRITGIDDGEDETVLDIGVKKGMNQGWFGEVNAAAGTEHRYTSRANLMRFTDGHQFAIMGGMNNVGDMGFGGPGGRGWERNNNGLQARKNIMGHFSNTTDKLDLNGSARLNYNGSDVVNETHTQNFVSKTGAFGESMSRSKTSNISLSTQMRLEWKPDTMTNIMFRPRYNFARNRSYSSSADSTFNSDPVNIAIGRLDSLVNSNTSRSQTYSMSNQLNGMVQLNRKLNNDGRNVTLRLDGSLNNKEDKQLSAAEIAYPASGKAGEINNRYYNTPARTRSLSAQFTYSEPVAYKTYLQMSYKFSYSYNKNDRDGISYGSAAYNDLYNALSNYRYDIDAILNYMDSRYSRQRDADDTLSQNSLYKTYQHTASLAVRHVTDKINLSAGVDVVPINTSLDYTFKGKNYYITKKQFNVAPRLDFRYNPDKMTTLRLNYWGRMSQPALTDLLDITDDSNPLNITKGNPNLKPAFEHQMRGHFNTYNAETSRSYFAFLGGTITQHYIGNAVEYDETTGVRTTKPENMDGNWNINGGLGFNTPLDMANKYFTLNNFARLNYSNSVGMNNYEKSTTKTLGVGDNLELSYRRDVFEITLNGSLDYNHSRNNIISNGNLDTWRFSYGAELQYSMPWGTTITTDVAMSSRRGYAQENMNTNELLWNAQLSHSMLKGKALTIALEVNDILGEQSNISRTINALMSSDSRSNNIYQYGMLRVIYKFSMFGGRNAMGTSDEKAALQNMKGPDGRTMHGPPPGAQTRRRM